MDSEYYYKIRVYDPKSECDYIVGTNITCVNDAIAIADYAETLGFELIDITRYEISEKERML